jgi:hypothetical protein
VCGQHHSLSLYLREREPVPIVQEVKWAMGLVQVKVMKCLPYLSIFAARVTYPVVYEAQRLFMERVIGTSREFIEKNSSPPSFDPRTV